MPEHYLTSDPLRLRGVSQMAQQTPPIGPRGMRGTVSPGVRRLLTEQLADDTVRILDRNTRLQDFRDRAQTKVESDAAIRDISRLDPTDENYLQERQEIVAKYPNATLDQMTGNFLGLQEDLFRQAQSRREREADFEQFKREREITTEEMEERNAAIEERQMREQLQREIQSLSPDAQQFYQAQAMETDDPQAALREAKLFDRDTEITNELIAQGVSDEAIESMRGDQGFLSPRKVAEHQRKLKQEQARRETLAEQRQSAQQEIEDAVDVLGDGSVEEKVAYLIGQGIDPKAAGYTPGGIDEDGNFTRPDESILDRLIAGQIRSLRNPVEDRASPTERAEQVSPTTQRIQEQIERQRAGRAPEQPEPSPEQRQTPAEQPQPSPEQAGQMSDGELSDVIEQAASRLAAVQSLGMSDGELIDAIEQAAQQGNVEREDALRRELARRPQRDVPPRPERQSTSRIAKARQASGTQATPSRTRGVSRIATSQRRGGEQESTPSREGLEALQNPDLSMDEMVALVSNPDFQADQPRSRTEQPEPDAVPESVQLRQDVKDMVARLESGENVSEAEIRKLRKRINESGVQGYARSLDIAVEDAIQNL